MTTVAMTYAGLTDARKQLNESKDCAVVAVALATGRTYEETHQEMARRGRRRRKGTKQWVIYGTLKAFGAKVSDVTFDYLRRGISTVNRFEQSCDPNKVYLVWTRGHILCVRGGKVEDWTAGRRHRPQRIEIVEMPNAPQIDEPQPEPKQVAVPKPAAKTTRAKAAAIVLKRHGIEARTTNEMIAEVNELCSGKPSDTESRTFLGYARNILRGYLGVRNCKVTRAYVAGFFVSCRGVDRIDPKLDAARVCERFGKQNNRESRVYLSHGVEIVRAYETD